MNRSIFILFLLFVYDNNILFAQQIVCGERGNFAKILKSEGRPVFYIDNLDSTEWPIRYFRELSSIVSQSGIKTQQYIVRHDQEKPAEQICIEHNMDSLITLKLGLGFRSRLIRTADSLFITAAFSKTIDYWACDSWPHPADEPADFYKTENTEPITVVALSPSFKKTLPVDEYGNLPSFFISFIVARDGSLSGFKILNDQIYSRKPLSKKTAASLLNSAKSSIIKSGPWLPGTIAGKPVRAEYQMNINF